MSNENLKQDVEIKPAVNWQIRSPNVRVIDEIGNNIGVMPIKSAIHRAQSIGLDIVQLPGTNEVPNVKIVDYNKYLYELKLNKKKQARLQKENTVVTKEIQLRPVTSSHDISIKVAHAREFLEHNHKVKIVIKFRGREVGFMDRGYKVMREFLEQLAPCKIEKEPEQSGTNSIIALVSASNAKSAENSKKINQNS